MDIILTPEELRVLGSLLEKEMSTPEYYPLTLNALVAACNQKTSRSPVVSYDEKTVLSALARLEKKRLIRQSSLGRVPKYEQSFVKNTKLINSEAAVLSMLMLRGPQTIGEIKTHTERLYDFADLEKVNETLLDLVEAGFIVKFPRMPGQKESRYGHLLSGQPEDISSEVSVSVAMDSTIHKGDERITKIQEELKALRQEFEDLKLKLTSYMEQIK
jgi:uncharacterized protein YceH (UPF0502 family)